MKKYTYDYMGIKLIRTEEAIPKCSQDFCDICGDCLSCYGEDKCTNGRQHNWIEYKDD